MLAEVLQAVIEKQGMMNSNSDPDSEIEGRHE